MMLAGEPGSPNPPAAERPRPPAGSCERHLGRGSRASQRLPGHARRSRNGPDVAFTFPKRCPSSAAPLLSDGLGHGGEPGPGQDGDGSWQMTAGTELGCAGARVPPALIPRWLSPPQPCGRAGGAALSSQGPQGDLERSDAHGNAWALSPGRFGRCAPEPAYGARAGAGGDAPAVGSGPGCASGPGDGRGAAASPGAPAPLTRPRPGGDAVRQEEPCQHL